MPPQNPPLRAATADTIHDILSERLMYASTPVPLLGDVQAGCRTVHWAEAHNSARDAMRLESLQARSYKSLRDVTVTMTGLDLFIGANAAGKSTLLDALRFLHEGVRDKDFGGAVRGRGGIVHMPWKGEFAQQTELVAVVNGENGRFEWMLRLVRDNYEFHVEERVSSIPAGSPPTQLLEARMGEGWWWSGEEGKQVELKQGRTACALAAAAADASFPAREVAEFVRRWGFFDPNPFLLRRDWSGNEFGTFDPYGRNLAETLYVLKTATPDTFKRILCATQDVLGLPTTIEPRMSDDRFYFVQEEPGLQYSVHQMGVSSGTLRMLALMTALFATPDANLIGIEEPENYVHPTAIASFLEYLRNAQDQVQFLVTTHSPLLLDYLDDPSAIRIVQRTQGGATVVAKQRDPEGVRQALEQSGFGLGGFYESEGFGAN